MSEKRVALSRKVPPIFKVIQPLRGLAILLVVLAHAAISMLAAEVSLAPADSLAAFGWGVWELSSVGKTIILEICRAAVPLFLFLAGYYMLSTPRTWKSIWSSCKKLLIPMFFWSLATWAFGWIKGDGGWSLSEFLLNFFTGTVQLGYFFIILISQYYVLSRWLIPLIEKKPAMTLIVVIILQLCVHAYDYIFLLSRLGILPSIQWILSLEAFPEFFFPRFIVSYTLGVWAAVYNHRFKAIVINKFRLITILATFTLLLLVLERGLIYGYSRSILGMMYFEATSVSWVEWKISTALWTFAFLFWVFGFFLRYVPAKKVLDYFGKYSFQIFLLHGMVIIFTKMFMYKFFGHLAFYGFFGTVILFCFGIFIPVVLAKLIQKYLPSGVRILLLGS